MKIIKGNDWKYQGEVKDKIIHGIGFIEFNDGKWKGDKY